MKRLSLVAFMALGCAVFSHVLVRQAWACSWEPSTIDLIGDPDVIVAGRFVAWTRVDEAKSPTAAGPGWEAWFIPIRVTMQVDGVYKGEAGQVINIVGIGFQEAARINGPVEGSSWSGGGVCTPFQADPMGRYVIWGLHNNGDGTFKHERPYEFESNPQALASLGLPRLPRAGVATADDLTGSPVGLAVIAALPIGPLLIRKCRRPGR